MKGMFKKARWDAMDTGSAIVVVLVMIALIFIR